MHPLPSWKVGLFRKFYAYAIKEEKQSFIRLFLGKYEWAMVEDNLQFEHHIEHSFGAVRLQEFNDVRMLQWMTDRRFSFQI